MTFDDSITAEITDNGITFTYSSADISDFSDSHDFQILDTYVHHFATDGIQIYGERFELNCVESAHNGRNALSLSKARDGRVKQSVLRDSGDMGAFKITSTAGKVPFGGFNPRAGVGIDPECPPPCVVRFGHHYFDKVKFLNNHLSAVNSGNFSSLEDVTVRNSVIQSPPDAFLPLILLDGVVEDSVIDAARSRIYLSGFDANRSAEVIFRNNIVTGGDLTLVATGESGSVSGSVVIENNWFNYSGEPGLIYWIILLDQDVVDGAATPSWKFRHNWLTIPENARPLDFPGIFIGLVGLQESTNNNFVSSGRTPWLLAYHNTQEIDDHFTRPDGLIPYNSENNLNGCVDTSGRLDYTLGIYYECAQ